jgi:hypothetical protein
MNIITAGNRALLEEGGLAIKTGNAGSSRIKVKLFRIVHPSKLNLGCVKIRRPIYFPALEKIRSTCQKLIIRIKFY